MASKFMFAQWQEKYIRVLILCEDDRVRFVLKLLYLSIVRQSTGPYSNHTILLYTVCQIDIACLHLTFACVTNLLTKQWEHAHDKYSALHACQ